MVWNSESRSEGKFDDTFEGKCQPIFPKTEISDTALAVSGLKYEDCLEFPEPAETMFATYQWINAVTRGKPLFYSDNNGFDFSYMNYYFHRYMKENPFGWSSRNINSLWHGMQKDCFKSFKFLRKTKHNHNPVYDAMGNAEALHAMKYKYKLKINF